MKPNNQPPSKLPAWVRDPRLERPLLIAIVCLSLFLAGLILYPAVNNYVNHMSARALPAVTAAADASSASIISGSSTSAPRPMLMRYAVFFIACSCSLPIMR